MSSPRAGATVVCTDIDGNEHKVPVEQLQWRPSAYGIVIKDSRLLVSPAFGRYNLPGGGVELGEVPEEAVLREIKEETNIDASNPRLLAARSTFFRLPYAKQGQEYVQSILLYYACDFVGGELSMDGFDHDEKTYAAMPEWRLLDDVDNLQPAGNDDWRPLISRAVALQNP